MITELNYFFCLITAQTAKDHSRSRLGITKVILNTCKLGTTLWKNV